MKKVKFILKIILGGGTQKMAPTSQEIWTQFATLLFGTWAIGAYIIKIYNALFFDWSPNKWTKNP